MPVRVRSGNPAFVVDARGKVVSWNEEAQRLLGYAEADVLGRPCASIARGRDVFGNVFCHQECAPLLMSRSGEEIRPFEVSFRKSSGEYVRVSVSSVCICNTDPERGLIVHVLHGPDGAPAGGDDCAMQDLAILVSDIEGSTAMMEHMGEGSALDMVHEHNEMLRACLKAYDGSEVQHTGDGLIAAFDSTANAARCAIAVQQDCARRNRRIPERPLRLRIGLHSGRLQREESRLFGVALNEAVRVCSHAGGGEILITDHMARQFATDGIRLRERGPAHLKGIPNAVELHEIDWQASEFE